MAAPANVLAFYAQAHWGSLYGVTDQYHLTPHKGLDCGLFHGTVDVPALHPGTVVAAAASSSVGHYVTVALADGFFDTYAHIVLGVKVGQVVVQGQSLGRQAVTQAEGGTAWRGQHTHLCCSRTRDGWAVWGYVNVDPTPAVIAVLSGTAGSGTSPLANRKENTMTINAAGRTSDGSIWVQFEPGCPFYGIPTIEEWSAIVSATGAAYTEWSDTKVLDIYGKSTEWAKLAPSTHGGGTVNVTANNADVVAALVALGNQLEATIKIPTKIESTLS